MLSISSEIGNLVNRIIFSKACIPLSRKFNTTIAVNSENKPDIANDISQQSAEGDTKRDLTPQELKLLKKDRSKKVPVEASIRYLKSSAYKQTYGDYLVWEQYRRNHKGLLPPRKTRKTCIRKDHITTGNPCPICRDEYLVVEHRNIDLLKQFISPQTGEVLSYTKTGLCQKKHFELLVAVQRAMDYGLLTFDVPFREFDYTEFYGTDIKS